MRPHVPAPGLVVVAVAFTIVASPARAEERDRIRPVHVRHAAEGVDCETCHGEVATSRSSAERWLPKMETCASCHDVESPDSCATCHTKPGYAVARPEHALAQEAAPAYVDVFSHDVHHGRGIDCARCHGNTLRQEAVLPTMTTCRECHATAPALEDCGLCHGPRAALVPASHTADWRSLHGVEVASGEGACENCHTETACQDCHAGDNVRPRSHGLNFTLAHSVAARSHEEDCAVCHSEPSFCTSCHASERVAPQDHFRADWIVLTGGGRHAAAGRLDLEACAACHDAPDGDPVCADCHGAER